MSLIEKEIANKEHTEPSEDTSLLDVLPIKTKSARIGKETKSTNIASKESLKIRLPQEIEKEVVMYSCNIRILILIVRISPYIFEKHFWYKETEALQLSTLKEENSKVVALTTSESIDVEEQPYFEGMLPIDQSKIDNRKSSSTTQSIENGLMEAEQSSAEIELPCSLLEEVIFNI